MRRRRRSEWDRITAAKRERRLARRALVDARRDADEYRSLPHYPWLGTIERALALGVDA